MPGESGGKIYITNMIDTVTISSSAYRVNAYIVTSSPINSINDLFNYVKTKGFPYIVLGNTGTHHIPASGNIFATGGTYLPIVAIAALTSTPAFTYTQGNANNTVAATSSCVFYSIEV